MNVEAIKSQLSSLRLATAAQEIEEVLGNQKKAISLSWISELLERELDARKAKGLKKRLLAARFPEITSLESFDFSFNPDIDEEKIKNLVTRLKKAVRLSELNESNAESYNVIIVDSIGNLASLYAYGDIAYVGGGFNASIHNVLEPAVFGMPVLFGPNHTKSVEAMELIETGGGFAISGYGELLRMIQQFTSASIKQSSTDAKNYVECHLGGTDVVYEYVEKLLS